MKSQIEHIQARIEPLRQEIINHKVYSAIKCLEDLQIFMQFHIYAVWDFMSLLKALQRSLTCVQVPWFPVGTGDTRYLINEIVTGEESDIDQQGNRKSHFELYLDAMQQCHADTRPFIQFTDVLKSSNDLSAAFQSATTEPEASAFVNYTFDIIGSGKTYVQSAVFTFGREDLIPNMFLSIINDINQQFPDSISVFKYYLERHIEVDGDHHSQLALQMTSNLCGDNEHYWNEAEEAVVHSLHKRIELWNGVYRKIQERRAG